MISRTCFLLIVMQVPLLAQAQLRPLRLSGLFQLGYTNSGVSSRFSPDNAVETRASELFCGLDINLRTYILDPRFISLAFEPSILRAGGGEDGTDIHRRTVGGNFYLEFLPNSYYPFRIHFVDQNTDYVQSHLSSTSSANAAHRSVGFDWTFRRPKLPPVFVSYDSSAYNYELSQIPSSLSRAKTFSILTHGKLKGWDSSLSYNKQATTEAFTRAENATDMVRGDAHREISPRSNLIATGFYQVLRFSPILTGPRQDLPFLNFHADLGTRHTEKLSSHFFYQYSRIGNLPTGEQTPVAAGESAPAIAPEPRTGAAFFHDVGGQATYQLFRGLSVGELNEVTFTNSLNPRLESPSRTVNVSGTINWQKTIKFLETRAGYQRGLSFVLTNFGNSRPIWFDGYNAGLASGTGNTCWPGPITMFPGDQSYLRSGDALTNRR